MVPRAIIMITLRVAVTYVADFISCTDRRALSNADEVSNLRNCLVWYEEVKL